MKHKLSISVDNVLLDRVRELVESGRFRNVSHAFEFALTQLGGDLSGR